MWDDDETYSDFARSQEDFEDDKELKAPEPKAQQNNLNLLNEFATSGNAKTDAAAAK